MFGYIYLTTNLINGRIYIGKHKSLHYDPSYLGSGKILKQAIKKYGRESFINELLVECDTEDELNRQEIYFITLYKEKYGNKSYNLGEGGEGGNTLKYKTPEEKQEFIEKITKINKARCSSLEFKQKLSQATSKRYQDPEERKRHAKKVSEAWANDSLRQQQSERLKNFYQGKDRDCSFNNIECCFELNGNKIIFESIKDLRHFLIEEYNYNPDRRSFNKLLEEGATGISFNPFHKNKFKRLIGMKIYKTNDVVSTNRGECSGVGLEISTSSKDGTR